MGGAGWIGALIQRGQQWADKGVDWAIYRKQRSDYAQQVRHLRRREYQDMMFSMRQAGLNPILAAGASPGHSAAMMGHGVTGGPGVDVASAVSGARKADAAERQAGAAERGVKVKETLAPYEVGESMMRRFNMAQQLDLNEATTAKIRADTELSLQESGTAAVKRALMERQAEKEGVSAQELRERILIDKGDPRHTVGRMLEWARAKDAKANSARGTAGSGNPFGSNTYPHIRRK